ncbi:MAG: radical SAM protein [Clostridia bacterium]|nr:radical SAM protein [Clostridia bacterium]
MKETIDCLLIGHNEMDINTVAENVKIFGEESSTFREFGYQYIQHNNKKFSFADIYNYVRRNYDPNYTERKELNMSSIFPLNIAYLGTFMERRNLTYDYVYSFQPQKEKLISILKTKEVLTIAITTTLYTHIYPIEEIVNFVKQYNDSAKIIVGGPFVANKIKDNEETALRYFNIIGADVYIYSSQGEAALVNTINCIKYDGDLRKVKNIYFKENDDFIATAVETENNNLEHNTVNWQLFRDELPNLANSRSAISCPFTCSFCGFPERAGKHYTISVEAFEKELNTLRDTNVKSIYIVDDTFNIPQERFKEIMRMMIRNKYEFRWNSYFRIQYADRETVDLMAEAGCEGVNLGLESGNQQILNNMNKKVTVEAYKRGLELLSEYKFLKMATFIIGFPGETEETVNETAAFIEESGLDYYTLLLWFCDPITPIYREKERFGIKGSQFNWSHSTMDSNTAVDHLDKIFLNTKNPTFLSPNTLVNQLPFALNHQEKMNHVQIKKVIKCFADGIAEKLVGTQRDKNISPQLFDKLCSAILNQDQR